MKTWELVNYCEFDKYASQSYCAIHGEDESKNLGDINDVDEHNLSPFNCMFFGSPCVAKGSLVTTDSGLKPIENVTVADKVLTHRNRFRQVLKVFPTGRKMCYKIVGSCFEKILATAEHPFYVRKMKRDYSTYYVDGKKKRNNRRYFLDPEWVQAKDLDKSYYMGIAINQNSSNNLKVTDEELWLIGRYIADGHLRKTRKRNGVEYTDCGVMFSIGKSKYKDFESHILDHHFTVSDVKTAYRYVIRDRRLLQLCDLCGTGAENKFIASEFIDLPEDKLRILIDGYMSGDGCYTQDKFKATSVSEKLIYTLAQCVAKAYRVGYSVYKYERDYICIIDGRVVNQKPTYTLTYKTDKRKQDHIFYENGYIWFPITNIEKDNGYQVWNMSVDEDESYCVYNTISHNCTDFSVAGNQEGSMWKCKDCEHEYNPITVHYSERKRCPKCGGTNLEKTRSSLLVEALRVLEANKPDWGIFENVKNITGAQFKDTFQMFLWELSEYGYNSYYQVLNAKDYGVPQNRERVFVIFIKKELDNGKFVFPKGFDNGLRIKDILLDSVDEKYYINTPQAQKLIDDLVESGKLEKLDDDTPPNL